ncbi:glycoside hydrolase family 16 protein [Pontiellaceae bacterium B12227]|nr:glycoside hydrolase family 16 protein [Pontiellaceae bacterium B12227]
MKILLIATTLTLLVTGTTQAEEWKLVWSDEFKEEGLPDGRKWNYEEGFERNQEMQYYMRERKQNARVENGHLIIEGRKETLPNPQVGKGWANWQKERKFIHYTSASLTTKKKFEFTYGRVEVRAKMPRGKGMWPAIWTLGSNIQDIGWPRCGEIDIMEYVGKEPHTIHANNHFANPTTKDKSLPGESIHRSAGGGKITIQEPYNGFHVYAMEWNEKEIKVFADDKQYATFKIDLAGAGSNNPFRKPHYLLLNLAMGGSWGGEIDDRVLPQRYEIDYVRVFKQRTGEQKNADGGE